MQTDSTMDLDAQLAALDALEAADADNAGDGSDVLVRGLGQGAVGGRWREKLPKSPGGWLERPGAGAQQRP